MEERLTVVVASWTIAVIARAHESVR